MAHYAFLDENNIVTEVIVGRNEDEVVDGITDWEAHYESVRGQICKRTSYNNNYRKHYAGIGYKFRADLNAPDGAFAAPQPFPSWTLDKESYLWTAPVAMPTDGKLYSWNEDSKSWDEIDTPQA
jgi:hypothetical protein